ncbi:hypothetical protein CROQUDRAFT_135599 [Cronartium quercuum f. sp. fusiforme G11]|uniref:Uncharacterized protein n=1 Tax=Cronartium quercuum f. sp. fusiforme G11 TaxID=708437 RepID=A0A9P6N9F2_9BASI|nr:hypothetical protein CROQUDRAFT_135599 [Cronartium quercuum f. sp. fusiforme G11]
MARTSGRYAVPQTSTDWIELRDVINKNFLMTNNLKERNMTWAILASTGLTGVLYFLCVYRVLYLKKFYFVKRDSFVLFINIALQKAHRENSSPGVKFVLDHTTSFSLYVVAGFRTWGVWCAMPPRVLRLRKSKVNQWHSQGPVVILFLVILHLITCLITGVPIYYLIARIEKQWVMIRFRLDRLATAELNVHKELSDPSITLDFGAQTLLQLEELKNLDRNLFEALRIFSTLMIIVVLALLAMFCYATIVILRTLSIQLKLIKDARGRANLLRLRPATPSSEDETLHSLEVSNSINERVRKQFQNLINFLAWKTLVDFCRQEKLDYSHFNPSIDENSIALREKELIQKTFCLQRHWWRVILQFIFVALISLSYTILALFVAMNFWVVGEDHYVSEVEPIIDSWRIWTWVSGPGLFLAFINCVAVFLDNGKSEESDHEISNEDLNNNSEEDFEPQSSTRAHSLIEGVRFYGYKKIWPLEKH